jgi:hypothetical protein
MFWMPNEVTTVDGGWSAPLASGASGSAATEFGR